MAVTGAIKRQFKGHFLEVPNSTITPDIVRLGSGIEEMNIELNPEVTKQQDIIGFVSVKLTSYEPTQSVEPYFAVVGDKLFDWLESIAKERKILDDVVTYAIDVDLYEDPVAGAYPATRERCIIAIQSYGGNTEGYQIPFTIERTNEVQQGTFNPTTKTWIETVVVAP